MNEEERRTKTKEENKDDERETEMIKTFGERCEKEEESSKINIL